jgi:MFS family permease
VGGRAALGLGAAVSAAASLLAAAAVSARHFRVFVLAMAVEGVSGALRSSAHAAYMLELAPARLRGRAAAVSGGVHRVANIVAPVTGGWAAQRYGAAAPFLLGGAAKALGSLLFLLGPPPPALRRADANGGGSAVGASGEAKAAAARQPRGWSEMAVRERRFFATAGLTVCGLTVCL